MIVSLIQELNAALRQLRSGSPARGTIPRQFFGAYQLSGSEAQVEFDSRYFANEGLYPFVLTGIDIMPATGDQIPSNANDFLGIRVEDKTSENVIIGNGEYVNVARFRTSNLLGDDGNVVKARANLLAFLPGGGYEIPPNGGFSVKLQTTDLVNNDGTGSSDLVYVFLYGYHITER